MARKPTTTKATKGALNASTRIAVLYGPEQMRKRQRLDELREALAQKHGEAEEFTCDGRTATLADVLDELRGYSLMQSYKLVIVDEADQFVKQHRQALERYAEAPVNHATLVLRGTTWNRGKLDQLIEKVGAVIKCEPRTPDQVRDELVRRAREVHGVKLAPAAAARMVDHLGPDLLKLDVELAKLVLMVEEGGTVQAELVDQAVGRGSDEQAYMVQEAVLEALRTGSAGRAIAKIHELVELSGQAEVLVTYFVADLVRKLNAALLAREAGVSEQQLVKPLKLFGSRRQAFFAVLRLQRMDRRTAGRLLDQAMSADARAKSGLGESVRNLECFCARLTDNPQTAVAGAGRR